MDQIEQLRAAASSLLEKAKDATVPDFASALEKAAEVLRLSSDLERSQAELRKLALEECKLRYENDTARKRGHSERIKDYVSLMTPIVTIVTLAATVLFQSWQFVRSESDKREAAEDAQWQDAIKTVSQTGKLSPGVIALNPFLKSAKYSGLARDTAVQLLANSTDGVFFDDLYGAAFVPIGWSNVDQVLKLDRALTAKGNPLWQKTWDEKTQSNDTKKLNPQEKEIYDYLDYIIPKISAQIGSVLKTPRPSGSSLNLSGTFFKSCDWRGTDLSGANIENINLAWVSLKGANLDKITQFENVLFFHVAWWEAEKIGPELLKYLETHSKYDPGATYGPKYETFQAQQYDAALDRLKRQTQ